MKWKPEMSRAWVTWVCIGFGQTIYALYVPNHVYPLGFVWGQFDANSAFKVGGSFVQPWARRNGVRTRINDEIFKHAKVISTASGSKDGGKSFLKASNYKWSKSLLCFYLERPKKKSSKS